MEYRNPGLATHYGKGGVWGTDSNVGTEIQGSTITSASDSAASGLTIRAKGTGALALGDSSNALTVSAAALTMSAPSVTLTGSTVTVGASTANVLISGSTILVGTSTSNFGGMNRGTSTMTLVELPASALIYSTLTVPGVGVNDLIFIERPGSTLMSTALGMVGYSCTTANEVKIAFINNLASTASILADTPIKFAYIKA